MLLNKKNSIDYIAIVILIFISGNLTFINQTVLFLTFIFSTLLFFYRLNKLDTTFIYFLLTLFIILILQSLKFNFFPINTYLGVFIRILVAYFILKSIGVSFIDKFIKVMYYISILSLIFYISILIVPGLEQLLITNFTTFAVTDIGSTIRYSILGLYTILPDLIFKNAGPFWEMGAFGGYLVLTLLFSLLKDSNLKSKINIILIITILTTQSTTAYISLVLLLFIIYFKEIKSIFLKILMSLIILSGAFYAYVSLEFMSEKIEHQLEMATMINTNNLENADSQRFINILKDWNDIQGHEIIGRGPHSSTRYSSRNFKQEIRTVGSTDMIVRYGYPFFILMLYFIYISVSNYSKYLNNQNMFQSIGIVFLVLVLLMSEIYFLYPLFWILLLLQYVYKIENEDV